MQFLNGTDSKLSYIKHINVLACISALSLCYASNIISKSISSRAQPKPDCESDANLRVINHWLLIEGNNILALCMINYHTKTRDVPIRYGYRISDPILEKTGISYRIVIGWKLSIKCADKFWGGYVLCLGHICSLILFLHSRLQNQK